MALHIIYLLYYAQDKEGHKLFKRQLPSCVLSRPLEESVKGQSKDPMGGGTLELRPSVNDK